MEETTPTRNRRLARVHAATGAVGIEGQNYQAWLKRRTGKTSCADLDDSQLTDVTDSLKPTTAQWRRVLDLCAELGLSGFEDDRFQAFVKRITKVEDSRLLSRLQLRKLIYALGQWVKCQRQKTAAKVTQIPAD